MSLKKGVQRFLGCFWVRGFFTKFSGIFRFGIEKLGRIGGLFRICSDFCGKTSRAV